MAATSNPGRGPSERSSERQQGRAGTPTGGGPGARQEESALSGVVGTITDKAQDLATSVASRAGDAWSGTMHGAQQAGTAVASTAGDAWGEVRTFMRRYPAATFVVGAVAGAVFARLLSHPPASGWGDLSFAPRGRSGGDYYPYSK